MAQTKEQAKHTKDQAEKAKEISRLATIYQNQQEKEGNKVGDIDAINHVTRELNGPANDYGLATQIAFWADAYQKDQAKKGIKVSDIEAVNKIYKEIEQ